MKIISTNNNGEREVDPYNIKGRHESWLKKIGYPQNTDYFSFTGISRDASELLTKYVLDLYSGKNLARGTRRGQRSFIHLVNVRIRLQKLIGMMEKFSNKNLLDFTEDDALMVFNNMRNGIILNVYGNPFTDVCSYAKKFVAFWRWILKTQKEKNLPNIVESLDTTADKKPKWSFFTLKDVEAMAEVAPDQYYRTLIFFLIDSGIRAPKELMNVRVKDFSEVQGTNLLFLTVREETSKTFGRKIKLMISSDHIKKFIEKYNLKNEDFLFSRDYMTMTRTVARMGHRILGIGTILNQKRGKIIIKKGISMYDFRHNSCCHYLPIYKSENQMKYRYGWTNGEMIHYYSEFIGMRDTISEDDMLIDTTKTEIQQQLEKEKQRVALLEEQLNAQRKEMEENLQKMELRLLQKIANKI